MNASTGGFAPVLILTLRLYLGVIFAIAGVTKLTHFDQFPGQLAGFLKFGLERAPLWYRPFLSDVVLAHVHVFAVLVTAGEICVAVSMIAGLFVRLGGLIALCLLTNYMLSKGWWWWSPVSNDGAQSIIAAVAALGAAGRYWGVDAYLARRWPKGPLW